MKTNNQDEPSIKAFFQATWDIDPKLLKRVLVEQGQITELQDVRNISCEYASEALADNTLKLRRLVDELKSRPLAELRQEKVAALCKRFGIKEVLSSVLFCANDEAQATGSSEAGFIRDRLFGLLDELATL